MTKTEYREYIASSGWQKRRKSFLESHNTCSHCAIPRWLAEIAYDQDLNVHHRSYVSLGDEDWSHLEALCRRCHEIETFGRTDLREPKSSICHHCAVKHWNPYSHSCTACDTVFGSRYLQINNSQIGKPIGMVMVIILASLWVQAGRSREAFLREVENLYGLGEEAAPQIAL